jgi:hypothetical protein
MALAHVEKAERSLPDGRRDVSVRITLLLADGDLDTACSLAEAHAASPGVLEFLARAISKTRPVSAAGFLRRAIEATLPGLDARHYGAVVSQIRQVVALSPGKEADAWVESLKMRYRARRKFVGLLEGRETAEGSGRRRR